jgi:hypothetical protein
VNKLHCCSSFVGIYFSGCHIYYLCSDVTAMTARQILCECEAFYLYYQTFRDSSLRKLAGYETEFPEDDVLTSKHVGVMD